MNYIKLQLGCMTVVLFVIALYFKNSQRSNLKSHKTFDALMIAAPIAIFLMGLLPGL